jgi:hypothetical protein
MLARMIVYNLMWHFGLALAMIGPKFPTLFH